jgi:hypothetical protein
MNFAIRGTNQLILSLSRSPSCSLERQAQTT